MQKNLKYALYKYSSRNIGDEIQAIAARQFLPRVDYYIDRDLIGDWKNSNQNEEVKLIANAWYMSDPMHWPIKDTTLDPLFISMHIHESEDVLNIFSSRKSVDYLKKYKNIGARDKSTKDFFEKLGLRSDFTACLTLTLQRDDKIKKRDFILCVTVGDEVYESIKRNTDRNVIRIDTTTFNRDLSVDERMKLAEQFLFLYQSAHLVVTTRLHAALPSLALETPITYITDTGAANYDSSRLEGLKELTNNMTEEEFLVNVDDVNFDKPHENPQTYLEYRKRLIETSETFTGSKKSKSFAVLNDFSDFRIESSEVMKVIVSEFDRRVDTMKNYIEELEKQNYEIRGHLDQLNTIRISSRKLIANIRRRLTIK